MSRFNTYNSLRSASSNDDDEEDEAADAIEEAVEVKEEFTVSNVTPKTYVLPKIDVEVPEDRPLEKEFVDNSYWKVSSCEESLDDLLKDFE
jgi:hypothetical protein